MSDRRNRKPNPARQIPPEIRFWAYTSVQPEGCWDWLNALDRQGYGKFWEAKNIHAHRYSYKLHYGDIPKGLVVCHRCDNPRCVRPDHLFIATVKENAQDAKNKGRLGGVRRRILNDTDARAIRMLRGIVSQDRLSKMFGINRSTVSSIHRGLLHVEDPRPQAGKEKGRE